ncbi:BamA/TamA family outer membrane protein [Cellulophaga baltica]|uniref:translocation and assembly module lipoprotein TamL n=1 Tax=Cellulophaga TaxID=104264 RepID=UPI001C0788FA|nr:MULTISPECIES: BamA/TamA family outer membrane protein [Cellulophaga]MBU2997271.1 BamA/TamA family outer membrane protein [Cellulophaga baltica]MDO6768669.1 BamA/TamA family outer membrane protein [Cellulophaga sp. 1_MG-2023]
MKKYFKYNYIAGLFLLLGAYSCGVSKYLPEGEVFYTGASINLEAEEDTLKTTKIKEELQYLIPTQPNSKFLGIRLGLYYHYKAQQEKPGFLNKWLNKKFGEEPVYLSEINPPRVQELMRNRLENRGFFYSNVNSEITTTPKYGSIEYTAKLPEPYRLEKLELKNDSLLIYSEIRQILEKTPIKSGSRFDLALLKYERERIDNQLKQKGYYNFNSDFLIFEADTNKYKTPKFDLLLRLKNSTPKKSTIPYTIDSITVYPKYTVEDTTAVTENTVVNGINFIQENEFFKPKRLEPYILFKKGEKYNANTAKLTSNRFSSIGSYKYVNIQFKEKDTAAALDEIGSLDMDIFLSPLTKRSARIELQGLTKSNGFTGPGVSLSYSNRNVLGGGETLSITGNFSYEMQLSGSNNNTSIGGGLTTDLVFPRLVPFSPSLFKDNVPKTKISLGFEFLNRTDLYTLTSLSSTFGYLWNENKYVYHELNPISINYVSLSDTTEEFEEILDENSYLESSFEQQFIAGLTYKFTFNELVDEGKTNPIYFSTNFDIAGNALNLLSGGNDKAFGLDYAQYAKIDADFRFYHRWKNDNTFIARAYGGLGVPYGNSSTLPYAKQFFSGGAYSVRAFQIRSLGPGTFFTEDDDTSSYYDQSGNLKLEANLEYRFPIVPYLKGALFADVGNIWLTYDVDISEDDDEDDIAFLEELSSKGKFSSNWAKELGAGVGFGLRVDIQSFVIRLDLASPFRVPYYDEGERSRIPFFDGGDDNLMFNFAIGYPF